MKRKRLLGRTGTCMNSSVNINSCFYMLVGTMMSITEQLAEVRINKYFSHVKKSCHMKQHEKLWIT